MSLGAKVKDKVTGFTGTKTAYCTYLHGSARVQVDRLDEKGNVQSEWFDEARIETA